MTMAKKRKTLPSNFGEMIEACDLTVLKGVFDKCELEAYGGYNKGSALSFDNIPDALVIWLVEQGADINASDTYKRTPLHHQSTSRSGNIRLFIELGSDIEASDYQGETPLHSTAGSYRPKAVRELLSLGANHLAQNNRGLTPLAYGLARCNNIDIELMAEVAEILLAAGTPITSEMRESVVRIGKNFEFHRANFNTDYLDATDTAMNHLYTLFSVDPVEKRQMHDGVSPITVSSTNWKKQYNELWALLIPSRGPAQTVQGEVIRITGKVSDEIERNGGANWCADFRKMLDALVQFLGTGTPLDQTSLQEVAAIVKPMRTGKDDEGMPRLCELVVQWVLANPNPVQLFQPEYKR